MTRSIPGSSLGSRNAKACGGSTAGSNREREPTATDRTSRIRQDRDQILGGSPLQNVSSIRPATSDNRQMGPASTGLSRNSRDQNTLRRGSSRRSQLSEPSTNWPMGICLSQSITQD